MYTTMFIVGMLMVIYSSYRINVAAMRNMFGTETREISGDGKLAWADRLAIVTLLVGGPMMFTGMTQIYYFPPS